MHLWIKFPPIRKRSHPIDLYFFSVPSSFDTLMCMCIYTYIMAGVMVTLRGTMGVGGMGIYRYIFLTWTNISDRPPGQPRRCQTPPAPGPKAAVGQLVTPARPHARPSRDQTGPKPPRHRP